MSSKLQIGWVLAAAWLALAAPALAGSATNRIFALRAEAAFHRTQAIYLAATNSATNALRYAQACFDLAGFATNEARRAEIARLGIVACRQWVARESNSAPGHYFLGMNLGQLARAEAPSLAAYRLVYEIEREFLAAAGLDARVGNAGPARALGELYFRAPGWPLSVGSNRKAREWLGRAVALAPDYPDNLLDLAEAQLKWRQREEAKATLDKLEALWPVAKTNLAGESWGPFWADWEPRRAALKADYQRVYGPKP